MKIRNKLNYLNLIASKLRDQGIQMSCDWKDDDKQEAKETETARYAEEH